MARKSRKNTVQTVVEENEAVCRAAIYVRLSVEDKQSRSASIETQQLIIAQYLEHNPEINVYHTYIDNGATGTNFHRPGFQQMLSDIEAGLVNCVIVKDLSRLGRNAIDTGYYIETYFRERNIRFIAINDHYDTADPANASYGIMLPLRNMINEAYALDIGRKIRASQRQMMKDGKYVGSRPPYGYLKAPDDCHRLVIDPDAAQVVRQMFQWASEGAGLNTIAVRLNEACIATPSHYKRELGLVPDAMLGNGKWQTRTVASLLHNEIYTGDMVQGHSKTVDHRQITASPDEWTVVRGTHEPIIPRAQFDAVQKRLAETAKSCGEHKKKPYTQNILKGKVFCACCGGSLHRQRCKRMKSDDRYVFHCLTNSRKAHGACDGVMIFEDKLMEAVTGTLLESLDAVIGKYALCLETPAQQRENRAEFVRKIDEKKRESANLRDLSRGLYENLTLGRIDKEDYFNLCERYDGQLNQLSADIQQLESGLAALDAQIEKSRAVRRDAQSIRKDKALTAELIDRLIERIEVSPDKQIAVRLKFQSEYESCKEVVGQCKAM